MSAPFPIDTTIPAAPNDPADDQPKMQTNFANIDGYLTVDHIEPGEMNAGYHSQVHMLNQSAPGIGTANGVLYCNNDGTGSWPVWQNAAGAQQLQGIGIVGPNSFTFLSPGLYLEWGSVASPGTSGSVTFPRAFSAPPFSIQVSLQRSSGNQSVTVDGTALNLPTTTNFHYLASSGGSDFLYWIAIGPR